MYIVILLCKLDEPYIFMKNRGELSEDFISKSPKRKKNNLGNNVSRNLQISKSQSQKKKKKEKFQEKFNQTKLN